MSEKAVRGQTSAGSGCSILLPCPLCGKAPFSGRVGSPVPGMEDCGYYAVECNASDHNVSVHGDDKDECEAIWNRRSNTKLRGDHER